jgi:hypothetical protein
MPRQKLSYSDFADRINLDALEEAIGFVPEYQRGDNDVGYCLWPENHAHGDTTGKFAIHRDKLVYNCYVCGGGDLLSLAMETQDLNVDDATHWLYQFCEEDLRTDHEFVDEFLSAFEDVEERLNTLPYFNERVLDRFRQEPIPEWWLAERQITPEVAAEYGVYYSSELERRSPPRGKFADDEDYVGPGIIFTHYWKGRLVGWQTRWLDEDRPEWIPKYTNTTDFPKETTIYGYDQARRCPDKVVVVESGPSSLFARSHGYSSVGTFGSSVNPAQMRLLRRFSQGVILAPDADKSSKDGGKPAGIKWRDSLTEYLKRYIDVWHLPPIGTKAGADLNDLAQDDDPQRALDEYLDRAFLPGIDL